MNFAFPVVDRVVVALGEELDAAVLLLVQLQHAVHDGDVSALNLKESETKKYCQLSSNSKHVTLQDIRLQNYKKIVEK